MENGRVSAAPQMDMNMPVCPMKDSHCKIEDISGPWIEVDLKAISHNIEQIYRFSHTKLMPVIKANAYGHGAIEVACYLEKMKPVQGVCVSAFREALELRQNGLKFPILNLGHYTPSEANQIVALNISQSVFTGAVGWLDQAARKQHRLAGVHIKIDTGLGRVGVPHYEASDFIEQVADMANIRIEGIFTSLSQDPDFDKIQNKRFHSVLRRAEAKGISLGVKHAAASAAILKFPETGLDIIRPGIMVFGYYPSKAEARLRRIDLKPALTLKTRVVYVKNLKAGDPIAYHRVYKARKNETIITGGLGYCVGYPSNLAGKADCLIGGIRHPLIAAVTGNHIYVRSHSDNIEPGQEIVLYGQQGKEKILLDEIAELSKRSEYHLLARLHPALPRFYS